MTEPRDNPVVSNVAPIAARAAATDRAGWLIAVAVVVAYLPALRGEFIWDDDEHVTPQELRSLHGLYRIWFDVGASGQYFPLLHSAFWIEYQLWGEWPPAYHALNVALHIAASLLVLRVMRLLLARRGVAWAESGAWLTAALFALHPVHAESVAWISEQKNTLSTVFYLLATRAYLRFDENRDRTDYLRAGGWFLLSLLSKSVTATWPAAMLVVFWWLRGGLQWRRDVRPMLPLLALGIASGLFTTFVEHDVIGAKGAGFDRAWPDRAVLAGRVAWEYLCKLAWPTRLLVIYPLWKPDASDTRQWLYVAGLLATIVLLFVAARRSRAPLAAALFYFGTLLPVIGLIDCYLFLYAFNFDHFQYLASLGMLALAGGGMGALVHRLRWNRLCLVVPVVVLGVLTIRQAWLYGEPQRLYEHTLAHNDKAGVMHNNLAVILWKQDRRDEALRHYERAVEIHPDYAKLLNNLGRTYSELGRNREAIDLLKRALRALPHYPNAMNNLATAYLNEARVDEAIECSAKAVDMAPTNALLLTNFGVALGMAGRHAEAAVQFEKALRDRPRAAEIHWNLARAHEQCGRMTDAVAAAKRARSLAADAGSLDLVRLIDVWLAKLPAPSTP